MRRPKFEPKMTRKVLRALDLMAEHHGLPLVRHAVKKWDYGHKVRVRLLKQKREIRRQMREVNAKLRG